MGNNDIIGTEEHQSIINLTPWDTSTDSNRSSPEKTVAIARFQQEPLQGGSRGQRRPGLDQDRLRRPGIEDDRSMITGSGKDQWSDNHTTGNRSDQLKPGQPRMLRPIRPRMEKISGPRISGPCQYHHRGSQSQGMVRKPGPTPVTGFRMPGRSPSTRLRMHGHPSLGHRMPGSAPVTGLSGMVARGGSHRRALSFPQNKAQNICSPTPQSEPNVSHYPTQAALNKFSNMGTTLAWKQSPPSPPASSCGEWNLPPGISISRIQESGPRSGMTVTSLANALHMLGEREGTKRTVSYRLTEQQIMALETLGFEEEPAM